MPGQPRRSPVHFPRTGTEASTPEDQSILAEADALGGPYPDYQVNQSVLKARRQRG